ncbi:MAG: ATP-binding protein [Myxococcota bacterium]|nr:ATP-binding protein [Myxococcota bacterium]
MRAVDIPQADSLSRIRELVQTVHFGASDTARLQKVMSLHPRHVGYHLHAARVLNWIERADDQWAVTSLGGELIATAAGSQEERAIFRKSISASEYLVAIAPNLLTDQAPEQDLLSLRIQEVAGIAPATARRRASTLLRWRTQSLPTRVKRFEITDVSDDEEANRESMRVHAAHVERYGLLGSLRVEFGEAPVFIGANSTGKSTLFDVFQFLSDALYKGIDNAISIRADRFEDLVWFGEGDSFALALEFTIPKAARYDLARIRYEVEIGRNEEAAVGVVREAMYLCPRELPAQQVVHSNTPRGWRKILGMGQTGQARYGSEHPSSRKTTTAPVGNQALGLSQLPDDPERFPAARRVRNLLLSGVQQVNFDPIELVRPTPSDAPASMDSQGAGLAAVIGALESGPSDIFLRWMSHIQEAIPGVEKLMTRVIDGSRSVFAEMKGGVQLPLRRLSKGSIIAIGLCTLGYQDRKDTVLIVEAPEAGVHPSTIEAVAQGTMESDSSLQIMLTTYSPAWVAAVPVDRLRRFVREAGAIRVLPGIDLTSGDDSEAEQPSRALLYAAGLL